MNKKILTKLWMILGILLLTFCKSYAGGSVDPDKVEITTSRDLKRYMKQFGTLVAGLEILKAEKKTPDWAVIDYTLREMNTTLKAMQNADKKQAYQEYTNQLEKELLQFNSMSQNKDPKIYDQIDSLTNTCFRCHAVHRPADFLQPRPVGMQSKLLFQPKTSSNH